MTTTAFATATPIKSTAAESSWEDIEYGTGLPDWTAVKNTFIDCPADRSWSLEEFLQMNEQKCKSCPSSGVLMHMHPASKMPNSQTILEESEGSTTDGSDSQTPAVEEADSDDVPWENITYGELPNWTSVKNTFIDCPADRSWSLEEFLAQTEQKCKSCPSSGVMMHISSKMPQSYTIFDEEESSFGTACIQMPPPAHHPVEDSRVVLNIAPFLPQSEAVPNIGSQAHQFGQCTPCGFVHKDGGCTKGASCPYCHLCPAGTIKERKQMKKLAMKARKLEAFAQRQQMWMGV